MSPLKKYHPQIRGLSALDALATVLGQMEADYLMKPYLDPQGAFLKNMQDQINREGKADGGSCSDRDGTGDVETENTGDVQALPVDHWPFRGLLRSPEDKHADRGDDDQD